MGIEEAFGGDFLAKYQTALKKSRIKKLVLEGETKNEVIRFIRANMKPETPELIYNYNNYSYDIMLIETPRELRIKQIKFGLSLSVPWRGNWLGLNLDEKQVEIFSPETPYVIVGKFKVKAGIGVNPRTFYNFNVHGIITMDEIANFKEGQEKQSNEVGAKIAPFSKEVNIPNYK